MKTIAKMKDTFINKKYKYMLCISLICITLINIFGGSNYYYNLSFQYDEQVSVVLETSKEVLSYFFYSANIPIIILNNILFDNTLKDINKTKSQDNKKEKKKQTPFDICLIDGYKNKININRIKFFEIKYNSYLDMVFEGKIFLLFKKIFGLKDLLYYKLIKIIILEKILCLPRSLLPYDLNIYMDKKSKPTILIIGRFFYCKI